MSVLVPPMSYVIIFGTFRRRAMSTEAVTPPAGPDKSALTGSCAISLALQAPPLDPIILRGALILFAVSLNSKSSRY